MIITATGWDYATVDSVTVPDAVDLMEYWKENPPLHIAVGSVLKGLAGIKSGAAKPTSKEDIQELIKQYG